MRRLTKYDLIREVYKRLENYGNSEPSNITIENPRADRVCFKLEGPDSNKLGSVELFFYLRPHCVIDGDPDYLEGIKEELKFLREVEVTE